MYLLGNLSAGKPMPKKKREKKNTYTMKLAYNGFNLREDETNTNVEFSHGGIIVSQFILWAVSLECILGALAYFMYYLHLFIQIDHR